MENKMKNNLKLLIILLFILICIPLNTYSEQHKTTYFSPHSFYFYVMGSWLTHFQSDYYYYDDFFLFEDSQFAPTFGIGFTIIDFGRRGRINIEGDFSTSKFSFSDFRGSRVNAWAIMVSGEYRVSRQSPLRVFAGIGVGIIDYTNNRNVWDFNYILDNSEVLLSSDLGIKLDINRSLAVRGEIRYYWTYDPYVFESIEESSLGMALSLGLELRL